MFVYLFQSSSSSSSSSDSEDEYEKRRRDRGRRQPDNRQRRGRRQKEELDPMDPAAYSEVPRLVKAQPVFGYPWIRITSQDQRMLVCNVHGLSSCVQDMLKFDLISKSWVIQTIWTLKSWEKKPRSFLNICVKIITLVTEHTTSLVFKSLKL